MASTGWTEGCGPQRFYWPFGFALVDGVFWVADTGNRRVLGWHDGIPVPGQGADVVLGQPDLESRGENRDGPVAANSLRWPHAVTVGRAVRCSWPTPATTASSAGTCRSTTSAPPTW
jgi:hypothetical protein